MSDNVRKIERDEETVVAGTPEQTVTHESQSSTVSNSPYVAAPAAPVSRQTTVRTNPPVANQSVVQSTTTAPSDQVVEQNYAERVVDPAAEKAAAVDWVNRLVWFLIGVMDILLAIRFVLLLAGANPEAGFAKFIYGITNWMVAPFAGLFGAPLTFEGSATVGRFAPEVLVAMIVYILIGFLVTKLAELLLGTNRTTGTVVSNTNRRTKI